MAIRLMCSTSLFNRGSARTTARHLLVQQELGENGGHTADEEAGVQRAWLPDICEFSRCRASYFAIKLPMQ